MNFPFSWRLIASVSILIVFLFALAVSLSFFNAMPVWRQKAEPVLSRAHSALVASARSADAPPPQILPFSATTTSPIVTSYDRRLLREETKLILAELIQTEPKVIELDLRHQKIITWEFGAWKGESIITTGKPSTPTRSGVFRVLDKIDVAYGSIPGQRWKMPYWLGIYYAGSTENGIHELPFINGYRESARSLGRPVSHGCVRLPIGIAKSVYDWAEVGTPVVIHH